MNNIDVLEEIIDQIENIKGEIELVNQSYDNQIDELDFESSSYNYNVANIEDERQEEISEIEMTIPDIFFKLHYSDEEEDVVISAFDIYKDGIDLYGVEKVDVI